MKNAVRTGEHWPHLLRDVAAAFVISRVIFYVTALFALNYISVVTPPPGPSPLLGVSWQWDGFWYGSIISEGYAWVPGQHSNVAFFPLFPLVTRAALAVFRFAGIYSVGVLVNQAAFLFALMAVWRYAEAKGGRDVAGRAVFLVSLFPTAFFFSAAYSEALFLLTSALSLLWLQRRNYVLAGAAGFFSSLARSAGILLVIPYLMELWRERRELEGTRSWVERGLPLLLIPAGVGLYAVYLGIEFGEPLAFARAQASWGRQLTFPLLSLGRAIAAMFVPQPHELIFYMNVLNVTASVAFLGIGAWMWRSDRSGAAFVLASTLLYLANPVGPGSAAWDPWQGNSIQSMSRYVVTLFPAFVAVARWAAGTVRFASVVSGFVALHVILAALFMQGHYVF